MTNEKKLAEYAKKYGTTQIGECHTNAALTQKEVEKIRKIRMDTNMSYARIAKLYRVSTATICRVCLGQAWKGTYEKRSQKS